MLYKSCLLHGLSGYNWCVFCAPVFQWCCDLCPILIRMFRTTAEVKGEGLAGPRRLFCFGSFVVLDMVFRNLSLC